MWPSAAVVFGNEAGQGFRVLGGFRLADGRALDDEAITAARGRVDALPYADPAKAPSENVLAILRAAARKPGELDALLLSEVVERLRPLARSGFVQRAIAAQARESGLDEDKAGLIAAAIAAADEFGNLRQQVEDELAGAGYAARSGWSPGCPPTSRCASGPRPWTQRSPCSPAAADQELARDGTRMQPRSWLRPRASP